VGSARSFSTSAAGVTGVTATVRICVAKQGVREAIVPRTDATSRAARAAETMRTGSEDTAIARK
jgi:hypothetical protein